MVLFYYGSCYGELEDNRKNRQSHDNRVKNKESNRKERNMHMNKNDQLLDVYRQYEAMLRDHGTDYKTVEETAEDTLQNQLRITRQMRNYLSHNPDTSFLTVSDKQIQVLHHLLREESQKGNILKQYLKTPKAAAAKEGELVRDVLLRMSKQKRTEFPVYNDTKILGSISIYQLGKLLSKNWDITLQRTTYGKWGTDCLCLLPETPMENVTRLQKQAAILCCTSDGTATGKFFGVYASE